MIAQTDGQADSYIHVPIFVWGGGVGGIMSKWQPLFCITTHDSLYKYSKKETEYQQTARI